MIKFEKYTQEAKFRSPVEGFNEATQLIEVRVDPLTGRGCRINIQRARRPMQASTSSELGAVVERSRGKCHFCPGSLEKSTPMFAEGMPDRIKVGTACAFPNLFPFGGFHAVVTFSGDHFLEPGQFTPRLLEDSFKACLEYFKLVKERHPEIKHWNINWNYMPPGAASIIHPHLQVIADPAPTFYIQEIFEKSRRYRSQSGSNYWEDLVKVEREKGERYIAQKGSTHWISSFAPRGNKEVTAIVEGVSSLSAMDEKMLRDFSSGLSSVLSGYQSLFVQSFTMSMFSGPSGDDNSEFFWLNSRIISRPNLASFYTNDAGFMERLHAEPVADSIPEDLAKELRKFF
ncbi:MAG: hypothetical protein AB1305_01340 [Candidatus Hadarchaeota archaeon]